MKNLQFQHVPYSSLSFLSPLVFLVEILFVFKPYFFLANTFMFKFFSNIFFHLSSFFSFSRCCLHEDERFTFFLFRFSSEVLFPNSPVKEGSVGAEKWKPKIILFLWLLESEAFQIFQRFSRVFRRSSEEVFNVFFAAGVTGVSARTAYRLFLLEQKNCLEKYSC